MVEMSGIIPVNLFNKENLFKVRITEIVLLARQIQGTRIHVHVPGFVSFPYKLNVIYCQFS
jgi:hypothetical protein